MKVVLTLVGQLRRVDMTFWEIRNTETGKVVGTEFCPGNAAEHHMVLEDMHPGLFKVFEVDEVEGA